MAADAEMKGVDKAPSKKWTAGRKKEAVLRLFTGEPIDSVSRELGVTIGQLECWKEKILSGMELLLKERSEEPLQAELDVAKKQIGELCMEVELLKEKCRKKAVFHGGR